ncbi:MAG: hypothetical protein PsegKO_27910 [Pseudohongiellaceae bacterium]|jgi:hypothetical protein
MILFLRAFALFNLFNGLTMLILPEVWYLRTPGASETGTYNGHFIRDSGIAFSAAAVALLVGTTRPSAGRLRSAWFAMAFIGGHGLLHLVELVTIQPPHPVLSRDLLLIVLPAIIATLCLSKISITDPLGPP